LFDLSLLAFIFGLLFGSFSNVIIWRWPRGENIAMPASHCPHCQTPIKWRDNIPIFSWLRLKGKCRACKVHISFRYPLVELVMGLSFALTAYVIGPQWFLIEALIFVFGLITISVIDLDHMLIPNVFTYSGMVLGLLGAFVNPDRSFIASLAGLLMGGGFFYSIAYLYALIRKREGLGGGDIKLLGWIGAVLGWTAIPYVILVSSCLGLIVGGLMMAKQKSLMQKEIPFGPYISLAALVFLWFKDAPFNAWYIEYLSLFGF
jgi:leader peptidase (prepilin peptidase) / N-methyltransferase